MALHTVTLLKAIVGVTGDAVELDDETILPAPNDSVTAWEYWLSRAQRRAGEQIEAWHGGAMPDPVPSAFEDAEVLLVQAEIVIQHGITATMSPDEIQTGAVGDGSKMRWTRIPEMERGAIGTRLRNQARALVTGGPENLSTVTVA